MSAFQLIEEDSDEPLIKYAEFDFELATRKKIRGQKNLAEGSMNSVFSPIIDSSEW
jgi:hypothetical protein